MASTNQFPLQMIPQSKKTLNGVLYTLNYTQKIYGENNSLKMQWIKDYLSITELNNQDSAI